MRTLFFCPRWGSENISWDIFCGKVKSSGYDGIEYAISRTTTDAELDLAWNAMTKNNLSIIPQHYDTTTADFNEHIDTYIRWLERIKKYPALKINSQTGRDIFSFEQNASLIVLGNAAGVVHETHRGKFSFAAHIARPFLESIPDLRLTLDASHWVSVAESLLEDQTEAMALAISRTDHIHARVGHPEGPQVADPRTTESKAALDRHIYWWDRVAATKKKSDEILTITPEFGPFPYMINLPNTRQPIADQWDINIFMKELLRRRY